MKDTPVLEMEDVVFKFLKNGKRNILDHLNLTIEDHRTTVIMGSSGCGKSTLAAVAAGLYPENGGFLESGSIRLYGHSVSEMNPQERAAYLAMMFQNPDLQFCMDTLRKEMEFCLENIRIPAEKMKEQILETAEELRIGDLLDRPLHTISGGEKQKAALACLVLMRSRCIVLDEPFANIDEEARPDLIRMLQRIRANGTAIVVIDHRLEDWLPMADEIILLGEGGAVLARNIMPDNLEQYRELFCEQGLFYPDRIREKNRDHAREESAISLEHVSVPKGLPKRKLFSKNYIFSDAEMLLEDVTLSIPRGKMTAVLGPSGSGKTTTFLSVLKQHPYLGTIRIGGTDLRQIREEELYRQIGMVFQNPENQFITQNVMEEVVRSIQIWNSGWNRETCEKRAESELEEYGLFRSRRYSPYMLSQGQQRKLAVLSVLAGGQKILLLDEPTYGQDLRSSNAIMERLSRKAEKEGLTVIFITHDRQLAAHWADRIFLLKDKKLTEIRESGENTGICEGDVRKNGEIPSGTAEREEVV